MGSYNRVGGIITGERIGVHERVGIEEKGFFWEFQSVKVKASAMVPRRRTGAGIPRTDGAPPFLRPPIGPELDLALAELPAVVEEAVEGGVVAAAGAKEPELDELDGSLAALLLLESRAAGGRQL